jgi:signal transduction histidine kinase
MRFDPRELWRPRNLAAVLVWSAIGYDLLASPASARGALAAGQVHALALLLHAIFLPLTLLPQGLVQAPRLRLAAPWLALLLALLLVWLRPDSTTPVLLIVAMVHMAHRLAPRALALAWLGTNGVLFALLAASGVMDSPVMAAVMHASFQLFAMSTAWYARSAEQSRDALVQVNAELLATRSLLAESARDQERLRLARELHDVAGHKLTALKLNLAAAARDAQPSGSAGLQLCARLADELLGDIRGVVAQLRAHDGMDLRAAIDGLAAPLPRPRVHVAVAPDATVATVEQAEAVVRAVQEALTNAARHGGAENAWVTLRREGTRLAIEVRDDGRGSKPLCFGNGLNGMRERLEALGGGLRVERDRHGGVALTGWLQLA